MVTQSDIAEILGMDVSSVNKILNKKKGPSFKRETIKRVFETARKMGYRMPPTGKGEMLDVLVALFMPTDLDLAMADSDRVDINLIIARKRGVDVEKVAEIQAMIRRHR